MDKYTIRQAIVKALFCYRFAPQNFNTILNHHCIMLATKKAMLDSDDVIAVRKEWNHLIKTGHILPIAGYDDYAKLSVEIRSKLESVDPLTGWNPLSDDEILYGAEALQ